MDSVLVSYVNAPAAFDLGSDTTLCPGESLMLTAPQTNDNIVWQDGSFSSFIIADQAQIYSLVISNLCGKVSDQFSLSFDDHTPVLNLPPMSFLCLGDELEINATQPFPATYLWNTGSVLPSIEVDSPGMYSVDVHTDCTDIHGETEVLTPDTCFGVNSFFIPNIFSPNGDNVNDVFSIKFNSDIQVHALQTSIFDRWGNMVFESDAVPFEWNGEFNGRSLDPGVYVYRIEMRYFDRTIERVVIVNGDVTLIR